MYGPEGPSLAEEEWKRVPRSSRLSSALLASEGETAEKVAHDVVSPILAAIAALDARLFGRCARARRDGDA